MEKNIKQEVMNYLKKTSEHTFVKPKATFKWGSTSRYECDYDDTTYFKVFVDGDKVSYLEYSDVYKKYQLKTIDVDYFVNKYKGNALCVISNILFLNKKMKSVKQTKYVKSQIDEILKSIESK